MTGKGLTDLQARLLLAIVNRGGTVTVEFMARFVECSFKDASEVADRLIKRGLMTPLGGEGSMRRYGITDAGRAAADAGSVVDQLLDALDTGECCSRVAAERIGVAESTARRCLRQMASVGELHARHVYDGRTTRIMYGIARTKGENHA